MLNAVSARRLPEIATYNLARYRKLCYTRKDINFLLLMTLLVCVFTSDEECRHAK